MLLIKHTKGTKSGADRGILSNYIVVGLKSGDKGGVR
jgi:hypothetical protein